MTKLRFTTSSHIACGGLQKVTSDYKATINNNVYGGTLTVSHVNGSKIMSELMQTNKSHTYERAKEEIRHNIAAVENKRLNYAVAVASLDLNDDEYEDFLSILNWTDEQIRKIRDCYAEIDKKIFG